MKHGSILVTGGAGYIGSHVALQLRARGERVVILDDLSRGFRQAALDTPLVVGEVGDRERVRGLLKEHGVDTVMHFAAYTIVPESVREPLKYYRNNTSSTGTLLECCLEAQVRHFVFSSTAAVYGMPAEGFAAESTPTAPINPYGASKLMSEWMLRDVARASSLRYAALRYFNVAGSDTGGRIGQATPNATLLIKVACEAALGKRAQVAIFGTDYPTPDGTGVRDYIHVVDLAEGHVAALRHLLAGGASHTVNLGTGHGSSVLDVVRAFEAASGRKVPYRVQARRPGDVAACYADPSLAQRLLGWRARLSLGDMCAHAWSWQRDNPNGYSS